MGVGFLTVNKNLFQTLCLVQVVVALCVCVFIIGQYHSGNNMSSKSGAAKYYFLKVKSAMKFDP